MERDIFICHAGEDKREVVRPLVLALEEEGIKCWVDEGEIKWGDSITQKVNEGLRISRFVVVVLSEPFIAKKWPERELYAALNLEAGSGEVKVLPLLVGDKAVRERIFREYPLLNDKLYVPWDGDPETIVDAALARLARTSNKALTPEKPQQGVRTEEEIPLPKMRKKFSQRDKDLFLKETFTTVKEYFRHALSRLETQYPEVETDFTEIHAQKFIAKIYLMGDIKSQCKIWVGGLAGSNGIAYSENRISIDTDNSFNELISIEDDGYELKLKFSIWTMYQHKDMGLVSQSEAAEILWKRFSSSLEHL